MSRNENITIRNMVRSILTAIDDLENGWSDSAVIEVLQDALADSGLTDGELERLKREVGL